ncbi:transposable element Tcb1 transposase [Trichonephila clavipes]|nr:transposable element Tcb1 transposase [Trichonephila clavipes]
MYLDETWVDMKSWREAFIENNESLRMFLGTVPKYFQSNKWTTKIFNIVGYIQSFKVSQEELHLNKTNVKIQSQYSITVSEFDRGRIVAYRDCELSFTEIRSRVGRNQTTVMRICDRWMQEGTTDRRGRSHPPQCTTSREDRQHVRIAVTDRSVTSRTIAQHIESVTHHSVSARTIQRRLQQSGQSARRPLLGLPLKQNHRRLRHQWCAVRRM